jgi:hypothetical protein
VPERRVPDPRPLLPADAVGDEGLQPAVRTGAEHAQRGVLRVHQLRCGLHDPAQHAVEGQVTGDRDHRVEQQA